MNNTKGFTLIEILIATAILALIGVLTGGVVYSTFVSKTESEKKTEAVRIASTLFRTITRDITLAFHQPEYKSNSTPLTQPEDVYNQEDIEKKTKTFFIGKRSGTFDELHFTSLSHRRIYKDSHESDQAEISYFVSVDPQNSANNILYKREAKHIDKELLDGGETFKLAEYITSFNLFYWDCKNEKWVDSWNSEEGIDTKGKFPEAVQISFGLDDFKGGETKYRTVSIIKMPNNIPRIPTVDVAIIATAPGSAAAPASAGNSAGAASSAANNARETYLTKVPEGSCSQ